MTAQTPAGVQEELAERVATERGADNALDVLVEIALFKPDELVKAVRANNAGTKVIFSIKGGQDRTCWAGDWTMDRPRTAAALRARAQAPQ